MRRWCVPLIALLVLGVKFGDARAQEVRARRVMAFQRENWSAVAGNGVRVLTVRRDGIVIAKLEVQRGVFTFVTSDQSLDALRSLDSGAELADGEIRLQPLDPPHKQQGVFRGMGAPGVFNDVPISISLKGVVLRLDVGPDASPT